MTYDGTFNVITSVTDELGNTTTYHVDPRNGNVREIETADHQHWFYSYYPQGMMKTTTDPLGRKTVYSYDAAGRLIEVRHVADASARGYGDFDAAGNARLSTDENGNQT